MKSSTVARTDYHLPRVNVLGVYISAINISNALKMIDIWIATKSPNYICVTPAHGVMECQRNPELRKIFNASGLTTPDGMSIVWILRSKGYDDVARVYGPDLMLSVCENSTEKGYKHFFYGGTEGVAGTLAYRLSERFTGLNIAGTITPPFRPLTQQEDRDVVAAINASQADIVWVGISTPKQEQWMFDHVGRVTPPVLIGVGAAFDFLSGKKRQAPRWIQKNGLEWIFRLLNEPKRLWRRYLEYPKFVTLVMAQNLKIKRYD